MVVKVVALGSAISALKESQNYKLPEKSTLHTLLLVLGLSENSPFTYTVSGKIATVDTQIKHNDTVTIIPHMSGG